MVAYIYLHIMGICRGRSGRYVLQVIIFNILNIIMFMEWKIALVSITKYTGIFKSLPTRKGLFYPLLTFILLKFCSRKHFYLENRFWFLNNNVLYLELL